MRILIDTEPYLLACTRYVDLNPVRAVMTPRPEAYRWSSYRARAGFCVSDWLDFDPLYLGLGESADERHERYRAFVMAAIPDAELSLIRAAIQRNQLTGTHRFIDAIEAKIGRRIEARAPGRPRRHAATKKK